MSANAVSAETRAASLVPVWLIVGAMTLLSVGTVTNVPLTAVGPIAALLIAGAIAHRALLAWRTMVAAIVLVILWIPIKDYELPAALPVQLEPYRVLVAVVAVAWLTSALIDPRVRLQRTRVIDAPLALFFVASLGSLIVNGSRVSSVEPDVIKKILFFASFVCVLYLVVSLLRRYKDLDFVVSTLIFGGAVVAVFAVIESRTRMNVFNHLSTVVPLLRDVGSDEVLTRGSRLRVFGSAQHPIALGAAFAVLLPLALARALSLSQVRWWVASALLTLGALSTVSRTAIVMLGTVTAVFLWLRPSHTKRLLAVALVPALVVVHIVLPGHLGTIRKSFLPQEGLIAQQQNAEVGSGRLATLGPALRNEFTPNPILGEGFGTRITTPDEYVPVPNAPILDNQWLGILLETGVVGAALLAWLFLRFIRRVGGEARRDSSPRGWLLTGVTASVAAFGVSMFTFDAFSFIQVTFLFFILLGLGSAALQQPRPVTSR